MNSTPLATFPLLSLPAMQAFAAQLAKQLKAGDVITLRGEVGVGKTAFARALIGAIAPDLPDVTSPTFTLMQSYDVTLSSKQQTLWHLDLYRLKHLDETHALGLRDIWGQVVLIEWPELIEKLLPEERLDIELDFGASEAVRTLVLRANATWRKRLDKIKWMP